MDYQVFCIIVFTLDKIQLLAAQPSLDCTGCAGQRRSKTLRGKKKSGGRRNELLGSSCFDCCFWFPALYSTASPVFITFNIMVIFIIYCVLMSSSPNLKPSTFWESVYGWESCSLSWKVLPNSWPKRWNITNIMSWSYSACVLSIVSTGWIYHLLLNIVFIFGISCSHRDFSAALL